MKGVSDPAALVVHNVVFAADRCPNEALAWERWIHDGIGCIPLLAWVRELAVPAAVTKGQDCWWQIGGDVGFVETRGILQRFAIFCRKLCRISITQVLSHDTEK